MKNRVFIIAEAGVNHNGRLDLALKLCDAAKESGVDAVKFQTFKTENILIKSAEKAEYQKENTADSEESQFDMVKNLELSYEDFIEVQKHCKKIGIEYLSTPDDEESLEFLLSQGMELIKVGSGEISNIPYLRKIGSKKKKVILSTGMSTLGEVERAYNELLNAGAPEVVLLHCTTNYPCPMDEVNLNAMNTLRDAFKCEVGYSDHTLGVEVAVSSVALGATILEKHFTLDKNMDGPDHKASLEPHELKMMVDMIHNIEAAMGNGIKEPNASELKIKPVVQRTIVAAKEISKGDTFTLQNLTTKRASAKGIASEDWDNIIGQKADRDYCENEMIELLHKYVYDKSAAN